MFYYTNKKTYNPPDFSYTEGGRYHGWTQIASWCVRAQKDESVFLDLIFKNNCGSADMKKWGHTRSSQEALKLFHSFQKTADSRYFFQSYAGISNHDLNPLRIEGEFLDKFWHKSDQKRFKRINMNPVPLKVKKGVYKFQPKPVEEQDELERELDYLWQFTPEQIDDIESFESPAEREYRIYLEKKELWKNFHFALCYFENVYSQADFIDGVWKPVDYLPAGRPDYWELSSVLKYATVNERELDYIRKMKKSLGGTETYSVLETLFGNKIYLFNLVAGEWVRRTLPKNIRRTFFTKELLSDPTLDERDIPTLKEMGLLFYQDLPMGHIFELQFKKWIQGKIIETKVVKTKSLKWRQRRIQEYFDLYKFIHQGQAYRKTMGKTSDVDIGIDLKSMNISETLRDMIAYEFDIGNVKARLEEMEVMGLIESQVSTINGRKWSHGKESWSRHYKVKAPFLLTILRITPDFAVEDMFSQMSNYLLQADDSFGQELDQALLRLSNFSILSKSKDLSYLSKYNSNLIFNISLQPQITHVRKVGSRKARGKPPGKLKTRIRMIKSALSSKNRN